MGLESYWGVGPKTRELLQEALGTEEARHAIESADVRALTDAGLSRGRATAILRRAKGGEGMAVLATRDARSVYKAVLDRAAEQAVTRHAADRIRVLTPLRTRAAIEDRLDDVEAAVDTWTRLDEAEREAVLAAFEDYDSVDGGELASVEAAIALKGVGASGETFAPIRALDADGLEAAARALAKLGGDGVVGEGADAELDGLRDGLRQVEALEGSAFDVLETLREEGVRGSEEFREAVVDYLRRETNVEVGAIREAAPDDAADATDFVGSTLRGLAADLGERVREREAAVAGDLEADVEAAREDVGAAVTAVDEVALHLSLARFAETYDLVRPDIVEGRDALAVEGARNLDLVGGDDPVQPILYGIGEHGIPGPPADDRVAVLTGANSGGKTTLLETLCQVALLAQMGLPVPAERAEVSVTDAVVFHRRHASFNAGVLESTLRTVVPPLAEGNRTLMLVDEFEAITEPGSAADLLHGLVTLTVERDALGVFVTHLADDLKPLPEVARTDGIFAEGLDSDLRLEVDYQPRFGTVGRSTPEFIVSRLVANAEDRAERAAFETLAKAVGQDVVQRTLADVEWSEGRTD